MKEYKHKQNDKVYFDLGDGHIKGWGFVDGIMGLIYIIRLETPIPDYPFTHIYLVDTQIVEPPTKL